MFTNKTGGIETLILLILFEHLFVQEVREGKNKVDSLTKQWYKDVRAAPSESEDEGKGNILRMEETSLMTPDINSNNSTH